MHSVQCQPLLSFDTEHPRRSYSVSESTFPASPAASFLSAFACPAIVPEIEEDAEGSVISGYTLGRIVGHGAFSTVRLASSSSSNGVVAVKIVHHGSTQNTSHESAVWSTLFHEHLLPLFSSTRTLHASYYFTLYCPAGSLLDIMNRHAPSRIIPQEDAGTMFRQVVRGLRYLHEVAGYIHGDMKLDNVLVDEMGVCRITDFGLAKKILRSNMCEPTEPSSEDSELDDVVAPTIQTPKSGTHHLSLMRKRGRGVTSRLHRNNTTSSMDAPSTLATEFPAGSLPYAAPESLAPSHFQPDSQTPPFADPAQDMWALGVMLFALLTGKLPFIDPFEPRLIMKILRGTYTIPADQKAIGRGAERLLKGCLEKSVKDRWSIEMVDESSWGVGWGEAAWEPEPGDKQHTEWEPAPTPATVSPAVQSRASSISRSRVRDRHVHDPIPMTAESRSKSRSSRRKCSRDFDDEMMWSHSQAPSRSHSRCQSRSQSRRRSVLCAPVPENDDDDVEEPPMRRPFPSIHLVAMAELNRGRRPDRRPVVDTPEMTFSALSISPTDSMPSTTGFPHSLSPSPSPSPTLTSPYASLILPQPAVRGASSRRSSSSRRNTRGHSRERAGVRFKDSDFEELKT